LLNPQTCARELLNQLYTRFPPTPPVNKKSRNTDLYQHYLQGMTVEDLSRLYRLSIYRVRYIIQLLAGNK
jgi:Mor family transcriptional regulator